VKCQAKPAVISDVGGALGRRQEKCVEGVPRVDYSWGWMFRTNRLVRADTGCRLRCASRRIIKIVNCQNSPPRVHEQKSPAIKRPGLSTGVAPSGKGAFSRQPRPLSQVPIKDRDALLAFYEFPAEHCEGQSAPPVYSSA
jgi:hypothetical protein